MVKDWGQELARLLTAGRVGESRAELARRSRVSERTIASIEKAVLKRPPRPATVASLAIATMNEPAKWLRVIGKRMTPQAIDALRNRVAVMVSHDQLRPAQDIIDQIEERLEQRYKPANQLEHKIKTEVMAEVESVLSARYRPATELEERATKRIRDYVDGILGDLLKKRTEIAGLRLEAVEGALKDLEHRQGQLSRDQRRLAGELERIMAHRAKPRRP